MPSDLESLVLQSLDFNNGTTRVLEDLTFVPAQKVQQWANNPNADGEALVRESNYTPAYFEGQVRVVPQSTSDAGLEQGGDILDALQSCERAEGGAPLEWTPADSSTTWTAYALSADFTELPIEADGETAGWLLKAPIYKFKLTCRPFLIKEQTVALEPTESGAEPQQVVYVECGGDVPAEAELVLTDKSSQDRRFLRVGRDVVESTSGNPPTIITAASLVTTNFSGEAKNRSGAYSEEKVKRGTAIGQATTLCGTGGIAHVGAFRIIAHVYAVSEQARYRISYRNGDGPFTVLEWKQPPVAAGFCDLDMGEAFFEEADEGEQHGEIRVEVKTADGSVSTETDLNYLELYPTTKGLFKARGMANNSPTKLLAYDSFDVQTEEKSLSGQSLPFGGTWSGAGDSDDFKIIPGPVEATEGAAKRTANADASLNSGRYAIAGSEEPTTAKISVDLSAFEVKVGNSETFRHGVFLRYQNPENWVAAFVRDRNALQGYHLTVAKCVGGLATTLGSVQITSSDLTRGRPLDTFQGTISLQVGAGGSWAAWAYHQSSPPAPLLSGQDSAFAVGGALEKGKGGLLDAHTGSETNIRTFDNFSLLAGEVANRVLFSGRSARYTSDGFTRQDSAGKYEGLASEARGADLYLDPGINRLVVSMRRNDADAEAAPNVTDKHSAEILVTERFLAPR